jgi:geranylgeranyl pyrophosphate synthase
LEERSFRKTKAPVAETGMPRDLSKYREAVDKYLTVVGAGRSPLAGAVQEVLEAGGKRLRPIIALLACEAVSGSYQKALPVGAAFELAHSASLVQDDIIDESDTRHGRQSTHKKHGLVKAILISDAIIFDIFLEVSKYGSTDLPRKKLGEVLAYIGNAATLTADGEYYEMSLEAKGTVKEEEYLKLAELKTGSIMAASAACGALVGGGRKEVVAAAYSYGLNLGVAFQIQDDILDILGNEYATGKPILKDLQNNATNMVLVHALAHSDAYQRQNINSMLYKKWFAAADVRSLLSTLDALGSLDHASSVAKKYLEKAKESIGVLPDSEARKRLEALAEELSARKR